MKRFVNFDKGIRAVLDVLRNKGIAVSTDNMIEWRKVYEQLDTIMYGRYVRSEVGNKAITMSEEFEEEQGREPTDSEKQKFEAEALRDVVREYVEKGEALPKAA